VIDAARTCCDFVLHAVSFCVELFVQEFVSYHGKNTTAPELAAKILSAVEDFKKS
jgi:hypothetical protein